MCFSANASFIVGGTLAVVAVYSVRTAMLTDGKWLAIAAYPAAFGLQQIIEGVLWLGTASGDEWVISTSARGFLFFSHLFWLLWVPLSVFLVEGHGRRRELLLGLSVVGVVFGLSVLLPSFLLADWLDIELIEGSIEYKTTLIYDGYVGRPFLRGVYAMIILASLFISSHRELQVFGLLIAVSLVGAFAFFSHAFISVWCFFAAVLSLYIVAMITMRRRRIAAKPERAL